MLNFKKVDINSVPELKPFMDSCTFRVCDYSTATFYMWSDYYGCEYCVFSETLFVKTVFDGKTAFSFPIGKLPVKEALSVLEKTAAALGVPLLLTYVPEGAVDLMRNAGVDFDAVLNEGYGDYIYEARDLALLPGKKYHKKKNKINKFRSTQADVSYEAVNANNISEVKAFFKDFSEKVENPSPMLSYEMAHCFDALDNFTLFDLFGGVLKVGGRVIAFTFAEIIGDTAIVHVEKCDRSYDGGYETINYLFSKALTENFPIKYVNREEDLNDEGLRLAKLSYHPAFVIQKYTVAPRSVK